MVSFPVTSLQEAPGSGRVESHEWKERGDWEREALCRVVGSRDWKEARRTCLPELVILHAAAAPSVQLIGIQSRVRSMRERITVLMEWGQDAVAGGTQEAGASGRLPPPHPVEPDSVGGWWIFLLVPLCSLTMFCSSPPLALHSPAEGSEGSADPKVKNTLLLLLLLSPGGTSVSVASAAAPTLTPPDGAPAGSAEVLPTEMAGITPLE
ncbi:unnamed protein product [Pleuronectes platessa]|uniref:Uncharacterized protein n=1 Tax=Pleuronectes platessa TaxID=8262 RepID=A0A9N7UQ96_PLEPL|nr:unnamed protein product [Pleuronectes platessa]